MKYHYKSPEEIRQKFNKPKEKLKNPMFNRAFFMLVADVIIILLAGGFLYYSGYSDLIKSGEGVLKIEYEQIEPAQIRLYIRSDMRDVTLIDSITASTESERTNKDSAVLKEIRWEVERENEILILKEVPRFNPVEIKKKKVTTLDFTIPETAQTAPLRFELFFENRHFYPTLTDTNQSP